MLSALEGSSPDTHTYDLTVFIVRGMVRLNVEVPLAWRLVVTGT